MPFKYAVAIPGVPMAKLLSFTAYSALPAGTMPASFLAAAIILAKATLSFIPTVKNPFGSILPELSLVTSPITISIFPFCPFMKSSTVKPNFVAPRFAKPSKPVNSNNAFNPFG